MINNAFEKTNIFSGDIGMGIFCLIMGAIVAIAAVVGLVGLWKENRGLFSEQPSYWTAPKA
jgi:hypothetical protein